MARPAERGASVKVVASLAFASDGGAHPLAPRAALLRRDGGLEVFVVERNGDGQGVARHCPAST